MDPSTLMASAATGTMMGGDPSDPTSTPVQPPQMMLLDFFFPGFSMFSAAVQKYLHIDLTIYIPLVLLLGAITFAWRYFSEQIWDLTESHLMSVVDIRTDDEIYNMLMAWVAAQRFSQGARRFVVNTNLNSRSWFLWRYDYDDEEEDDADTIQEGSTTITKKDKKALAYTPTFGSHWFWYKGRLLIFRRSANREQNSYLTVSEREEISISCFGRNPWVLKELLHEARQTYMKRDEAKTLIYRGTSRGTSSEPTWQRCMARTSRPFSTVILNEKVKKDLIDDVTDYLNPATRRWYSNRGIPYRRGYLLYGPPGTGKSSLSLALAGFFKMRIYIVSLSSPSANEENLASLFAELPRRCVVLLEDIDSAGLTHTREAENNNTTTSDDSGDMVPGQITTGNTTNNNTGRLSLSGLLNILDGVASQEGRVLIMTTNHLEKLDKALIRPGRVDMIVKFDRADKGMAADIFKAIFAPLEGDDAPVPTPSDDKPIILDAKAEKEKADKQAEDDRKKAEKIGQISKLAEQFAAKIPEREFSPAEIQGYLLKNKRNPEGAVEGAEQFIEDTRKEKREKEAKDEEQKKKEEAKKAEEKKKEEEEKKKKEEEEKAEKEKKEKEEKEEKEKKKNKSKSKDDEDSSSSSDSDSDSEAESEYERWRKWRKAKKAKKAAKKADKKSAKSKNKAVEKKSEATEQQPSPDTPPLTPNKATFETAKSEVPAIRVDELKVAGQGSDSGYGTPTASVKGDEESDAGVVSVTPAIKA